jgi:uncharacterized protein YbbK (DUF523 family)
MSQRPDEGTSDVGQSPGVPGSEQVCASNVAEGEPVLVSACMLGVHCRYDASTNPSGELLERLAGACVIPVCPEQLGGLCTPRPPAHLQGGDGAGVLDGKARVVTDAGTDVTAQYLQGASEALRLARLFGTRRAILKERSPSCGCTLVHRDGAWRPGSGVTAALLRREGIVVESLDPPKQT